MSYQQLIVSTTETHAEEISQFMWNQGAFSTTFEDNKDNPIFEPELNTVVVWPETNVVGLFENEINLNNVVKTLLAISKFNLTMDQVQILDVEDKDWTRAWMDGYKPMQFGSKLWICPTNEELDPRDKIIVTLDPGLAFGTGTHPTTRMCLQWLDIQHEKGTLQGKTVIDYGCGSGILAIAAAKLGAAQVIAVDIDPQAIEATISNSKINEVEHLITPYLVKDFDHNSQQFDILIANILAGPLVELSPTFKQLTKQGSLLALSGILAEKEQSILDAYQPEFAFNNIEHDEDWIRCDAQHI